MKQTLRKHERIKSDKLIDSVFRSGNKVLRYPLLLFWLPLDTSYQENQPPLLFGVSVSKRRIRSAVRRNTVKRRIREAYRLQKNDLLDKMSDGQPAYALFYVYLAQNPAAYSEIETAMQRIHKQLIREWK